MSKTYTIRAFEKGDFQDNHGNYWCTMVVEGLGEPVKIVVKDPMKYEAGQELYGDITEQTSKAGNTYLRFKRAPKEDAQTHVEAPQRDDTYWAEKDLAIRAQWAIGQVISYMSNAIPQGKEVHLNSEFFSGVEQAAKQLFLMVDRVKQPEQTTKEDTDVKQDIERGIEAEQEYNDEVLGLGKDEPDYA